MGDDIGGIAVHTGARVAAEAGPGEVLVSSTVKDLVAGSGIAFEDRGVHALKGVPGRVAAVRGRVHLVGAQGITGIEGMAELPSGTVTFLLTDVEGSTALWEEAPEAMRAALARHDALFEAAGRRASAASTSARAARATAASPCSPRLPMPWPPPWRSSGPSRPRTGRRRARSGCGSASTPARPSYATATTTARR